MNNQKVQSLGHAVLVLAYISGVAWLLSNGEKFFGSDNNYWVPVAMLMLFVFSATVTGSLVLGRPILMYLEGQKKEAVKFFGLTVGWMFMLTLVVFAIMVASK